jgi:hypothetical protein
MATIFLPFSSRLVASNFSSILIEFPRFFHFEISLGDNTFAFLTHFWGPAGAQLVEALHYKAEGRGFDSRWRHWNFSLP